MTYAHSCVVGLALLLLAGCAYVRYERVYAVEPNLTVEQRSAAAAAVETFFVDRGYVLTRKYRVHTPESAQVSVFDISKTIKRDVREAEISVWVRDRGIELAHEEWFYDNNPIGPSRHLPDDQLGLIRGELVAYLRERGISVDLRLARRGYF